jgi:hypothetical protein
MICGNRIALHQAAASKGENAMKRSTTFCATFIAALLTMTFEATGQTPAKAPSPKVEAKMLARAEARIETLKSQLLNLQMKEIALQSRLSDLDYAMRPDNIQRAVQFIGSPRPMDEFRDEMRKALETEKARVNQQLELINSTRSQIETATSEAEAECMRLRKRLGLIPSSNEPAADESQKSDDGNH